MSLKSHLAIFANLLVVGLMILAGCTKAQVSVLLTNQPPTNLPSGPAITSSRESLAAATGVAVDGAYKIKFSIGYNQTGDMTSDGSTRIRATAPEVALEQ